MSPKRREQKKRDTFASIVGVVERLVAERDLDDVTVEDIAAGAGVSPGTVYNYFGTKNAILVAVVTKRVEEALAHADAECDRSAAHPVDALMPLVDVYLDATVAFGKPLLKQVFRASFDPAESEMLTRMVSLDERILAQLVECVRWLDSQGLLAETVDVGEASLLIYTIVGTGSIMWATMPDMSIEELRQQVRSQIALACVGLLPAEESGSAGKVTDHG